MCGRYSLTTPAEELAEHFDLADIPGLEPRYNIAPTQQVAVLRRNGGGEMGLSFARWGLSAPLGQGQGQGQRSHSDSVIINARSETVLTKPAFRDLVASQRCLIPADGFYEWRSLDGRKQPYLFSLAGRRPFAFAGLWDSRPAHGGSTLQSCVILTTSPNDLVRPLHDRMPIILPEDAYDKWLEPSSRPQSLTDLFLPFPGDQMRCQSVNPIVNSSAIDTPQCIAPYHFVTQGDLFS